MKKVFLDINVLLAELNAKGTVVFTNGCFDVLHAGHVDYLEKAKTKGDILVVAVNSDASVAKLKGPNRPVFSISERLKVLNALECVNYLTVFNEDTPIALIKKILPDVLVKGSDYNKEDIVGYKEVINNGGSVETIDFIFNTSSTNAINKLKLD